MKPMLGRPAKTFQEFYKLTKKFRREKDDYIIAEYKYDGERTQIHFDATSTTGVSLFSRNFDKQNEKFWLLVDKLNDYFKGVKDVLRIDNLILDGEIVYLHNTSGKILPFQNIRRTLRVDTQV